MRLVIFDIDGTLVRGSTERMFWSFLRRRGRQGPRQIGAYLLFWLRYGGRWGALTAQKNKAYLSGLETRAVQAMAREFVSARLPGALHQPAVRRLGRHLEAGDRVALMSGTLECIARPLAERLGVELVCATVCSEDDGVFSVRPPKLHPSGATKLELAEALSADLGLSLAEAWAYGNSLHDLTLLSAVGTPVVVRPDARLRRVAESRDWEILPDGSHEPTLAS